MKLFTVFSGAALAAVLATAAAAQTSSPPSAEKLALARQMIEASGGVKQANALVQAMFKAMGDLAGNNLPADQQRLRAVLMQKMQQRFTAVVPQIIDAAVQVYAKDLSEKELRDYVAWMQSDSAQSINRKMPQITMEAMQVMTPAIVQVTEGLKQDVVDEACKQASCSAEDRQVLAAALDKAMPKRPS